MNRRGTICSLKCDSSGFNGFVDWGFFQAVSIFHAANSILNGQKNAGHAFSLFRLR